MGVPTHITPRRRPAPSLYVCPVCLEPLAPPHGTHVELTACPGTGRPVKIDTALYERVLVLLGRRYTLYRLLKGADLDGLSHRVASEMGVPMPGQHLESLVGEGHRIETVETTVNGLPTRLITLVRDAWATN